VCRAINFHSFVFNSTSEVGMPAFLDVLFWAPHLEFTRLARRQPDPPASTLSRAVQNG
jgi:hypothetical protein